MPRETALTADEARLWYAWRTSSEAILARVARDVVEATGVSAPDFDVLASLVDLGEGRLRQRELATALGWDKSRISHHLTRMQERGLLRRSKSAELGSRVEITALGRRTLAVARPAHARAVRRHFIERLGPDGTAAAPALVRRVSPLGGDAFDVPEESDS